MDLSKSRKVNRQIGVLEEKLLTLEKKLETMPKQILSGGDLTHFYLGVKEF